MQSCLSPIGNIPKQKNPKNQQDVKLYMQYNNYMEMFRKKAWKEICQNVNNGVPQVAGLWVMFISGSLYCSVLSKFGTSKHMQAV